MSLTLIAHPPPLISPHLIYFILFSNAETGGYVAIESQEGIPTTRGIKVQESNANYYQSILEDASR
jgi:hypothetical protein